MAKLWIARWRNNSLHLYNHKPHRVNNFFWANDGTLEYNSMPLDADMFPEVTYENSPVEVNLHLCPPFSVSSQKISSLPDNLVSQQAKDSKSQTL